MKQKKTTLLAEFDADLLNLQQRVGIDRTQSTYIRQRRLQTYVADFIADTLHMVDVPLAELTPAFIHDFATWLSTHRHYQGGTVWLACQQLKSVVSRAFQRGLINNNPFYTFHVGRNVKPRQYLTEQELRIVMSIQLKIPQQIFHRDLFVFSALTGMSFADICRLSPNDIHIIDGQQWIVAQRHKTHTQYQVRLLPQAVQIISRYSQRGNTVFGPINYRTLAKHIPLLMKKCGILKHITFHCARHSFAVTALNAGMPIESISRILGHSNITTTQIYAKITLAKLNQDMDRLELYMERNDKKSKKEKNY